jgi:hypothetical protein
MFLLHPGGGLVQSERRNHPGVLVSFWRDRIGLTVPAALIMGLETSPGTPPEGGGRRVPPGAFLPLLRAVGGRTELLEEVTELTTVELCQLVQYVKLLT